MKKYLVVFMAILFVVQGTGGQPKPVPVNPQQAVRVEGR
jgi:hypothetical protein